MNSRMQTATFQTRARVIELLGKEQIADAPTALSELLKNAIDAFAQNGTVRFSTARQVLEVADDGLGMRTQDVLHRWLVVATESKRLPMDPTWMAFASPEQRTKSRRYPPLGQKGIGRLAAAALGEAILIWTRWGEGPEAQRTLMFIHWGVFEHPTLSLSEIPFPFLTFSSGKPSANDALALVEELHSWLGSDAQEERWQYCAPSGAERNATPEYMREVAAADRNLRAQRRRILRDLNTLRQVVADGFGFESAQGTTFFILAPTDQTLELFQTSRQVTDEGLETDPPTHTAGDPSRSGQQVPDQVRLLLGFSDPFGAARPRMNVRFEVDGRNLSELYSFWSPTDFVQADHEIQLQVDWSGRARGTIRRFDEIFDYSFEFAEELPRYHRYPGPFTLHVGYVAGRADTSLCADEFVQFDQRLQHFGALYVYRDGIRVLPYGRSDQDFLGFEEQRSKHAGRYFFSYRRMFGAVYIESEANSELKDKAGREGFIKNGAYRGFVLMLQQIFRDLALRYYGTGADRNLHAPLTSSERLDLPLRLLEARATAATQQFLQSLKHWREHLDMFQTDFTDRCDALQATLKDMGEDSATPDRLAAFDRRLGEMRQDLKGVLDELGTEPPAVARVPDSVRPILDTYLSERQQFELAATQRLGTLAAQFERTVSKFLSPEQRAAGVRNRIDDVHRECEERLQIAYQNFREAATETLNVFAPQLLANQLQSVTAILQALGPDPVGEVLRDESGRKAIILETLLAAQARQTRELHLPFWSIATAQVSSLDTGEAGEMAIGALSRAIERLEEKGQALAELAQLGLIVETIDHDFNVLFADFSRELRELESMTPQRSEAGVVLNQLRHSLESIQQRARLLSPVYRRADMPLDTLTGVEIRRFIDSIYTAERRGDLSVQFTDRFLQLSLKRVYKPVVLSAAANLVENGSYWTTRGPGPRVVRFSVVEGGFVVSDSGPGIAPRDRERVFEPFFSRRPGGRGLGLYIARANLEAKGLEILVAPERIKGALSGANFLIRKRVEGERRDD